MFETLLSLLFASTIGSHMATQEVVPIHQFDDRILLSVTKVPLRHEEAVAPSDFSARGIISVDLESQALLFQSGAHNRLPIASLTKLMTAYIVLTENQPEDIVTVSAHAAGTGGSRMGLWSGEKIKLNNLLYGMLLNSGNDSAVALAEFNAGSEQAFVEKMNQRAKDLGMETTVYRDSTGLNPENMSSARDLALLTAYLSKNDRIRQIAVQNEARVQNETGSFHQLKNTNELLGKLGVKGLKTGKTPEAGECLITLAENPDGHEIITVMLGSGARFAETQKMLEWIYNSYTW